MGNLQTKWPGTAQSKSPSSSLLNGSGQQHPQPPLAPLSSNPSHHHQTPQKGALCGELQGKLELNDKGQVGVQTMDKVSNFGQKGANGEAVVCVDEVDDHRDTERWEINSWEDDCVRAKVMVSAHDGVGDGDGDGNVVGAEKKKKTGGGGRGQKKTQEQYPKKPEARDCVFYMKTGTCKFGLNCKFNHPIKRKIKIAKEQARERQKSTERSGQTECKVANEQAREREEQSERSGQTERELGKDCKQNRKKGEDSTLPAAELNFLDLPIRPGEKDCPYYMKHVSCKFGENCKYNHPDPTIGGCDPPSPVTVNETSFVPMMLLPTQVSPQGSDRNAYQEVKEPIYPSVMSMHPPTHVMNNPAINTNAYMPQQQQMQVGVDEFAEIPEDSKSKSKCKSRRQKNKLASLSPCNLNDKGLPLMNNPAINTNAYMPQQQQMQVGVDEFAEIPEDSKSKSKRKSRRQKNKLASLSPCNLNDKGLPLKPDKSACPEYTSLGICKFGAGCKFDHPSNPLPPSTTHSLDQQSCTNSAGVEVALMSSNDPTIQQSM